MLNVRYIFRLIKAFITRFKFLIMLGVVFGIVIFFVFKFLIPNLSKGQTLRIGKTGRYTVSTLPIDILSKISKGLTKIENDGTVVPDLASSWETTDKGKTWIFTLSDNHTWQDGKSIKSSDIKYQFSDVVIETPDETTIIFKLQNVYSAFPSVVSKPIFKSGLLGMGEWKVSKLSLNGSIVEEISLESTDKKNIIYKFYPTEERTKLAFQLGEVDRIEDMFNLNPFNEWKLAKISTSTNYGQFVAVFFNNQDKLLSEKDLRQALSYAIDKEKLGEERAISPISKNSWVYNSQVKTYDYDPKKAKEMVDNYKKVSQIDTVTIVLSTPLLLLNKAEIIAENWRAVGIDAIVQVVSALPTDYQAFLVIYDIPDDPDQYSMWHSTQTSTNITKYQGVRIDKLLEDGRSEIGLESRKKTYLDFQRFLIEDAPGAFLYYPTTYSISRR